jgi:8-oxo-dGTP diphosphatase
MDGYSMARSFMKQAVSCIIFSKDRKEILLVKRRDIPVWVLPGGGIEKGESPEDAALRETLEETGFQARIKRKIAEYESVNSFTQPTHFFECEVVSGDAVTTNETQDIAFFNIHALPKLLAPPYSGWIQDAIAEHPHLLRKKIEGVSYWTFLKVLVLHPILTFRFLLTRIGIHLND